VEDLPVKTIKMEMVMLMASSMFPMTALMAALPRSRIFRGLSYIVSKNLRNMEIDGEEENSLYPCVARSVGTIDDERPFDGSVRKKDSTS
jgi:hypothetical protein